MAFLDTLKRWPLGTPLPADGRILFFDPATNDEYSLLPEQLSGPGAPGTDPAPSEPDPSEADPSAPYLLGYDNTQAGPGETEGVSLRTYAFAVDAQLTAAFGTGTGAVAITTDEPTDPGATWVPVAAEPVALPANTAFAVRFTHAPDAVFSATLTCSFPHGHA